MTNFPDPMSLFRRYNAGSVHLARYISGKGGRPPTAIEGVSLMRHVLATALLSLAAPAFAQAGQPAPPHRVLMQGMMSPDGTQTRDQAAAMADAMFYDMDTNHDGQLSPDERAAARAMHHGARSEGAGGPRAERPISREQYRARALARFDRMDANHDGKVDSAERAAFRTMQRERRDEGMGNGATPPAMPAPQ